MPISSRTCDRRLLTCEFGVEGDAGLADVLGEVLQGAGAVWDGRQGDAVLFEQGAGQGDGAADGALVDAEQVADGVLAQAQAVVEQGGYEVVGEVEPGGEAGPAGVAAGAAAGAVEAGLALGVPGQGKLGGEGVELGAGHPGQGGMGQGVLAGASGPGPG